MLILVRIQSKISLLLYPLPVVYFSSKLSGLEHFYHKYQALNNDKQENTVTIRSAHTTA